MITPEQIVKHAKGFVSNDAWKGYTHEELVWWVRLLTKRAKMRPLGEKRDKDLYDADNYLSMLKEYITANADNVLSHIVTKRAEELTELTSAVAAEVSKDKANGTQ